MAVWSCSFLKGLTLTLALEFNVTFLHAHENVSNSGMWGIFYYREISHPRAIRNWFLSASLSVTGIIWLSRERMMAKSSGGPA
jgi:hypothetical protein